MKIHKTTVLGLILIILAVSCQPAPVTGGEADGTPVVKTVEPLEPEIDPEEKVPNNLASSFSTDFSKRSISFDEILSGGPPKDGIPSIDQPDYDSVAEADEWLADRELVIRLVINDQARAYPLQILTWHEIANDTVGGDPVVVTFCPLCNTAIVFKRTVAGQVLDFGTTGRLRFSNLLMYDRQTESWWQQGTGGAVMGDYTGTQLEFVPASIIAWEDFREAHPDGTVLSRDTGYMRSYGSNPYTGYDDVDNQPFLYRGPEVPGRLPPVARVLALDINDDPVAYPYETLSEVKVVNDTVGGEEVVIFWTPGTASALDTISIEEGRDVGSATAFDPVVDGMRLTFVPEGDKFEDEQTSSTWNHLGLAIEGDLEGSQLTEMISVNHLWFSWSVFRPETRVYEP